MSNSSNHDMTLDEKLRLWQEERARGRATHRGVIGQDPDARMPRGARVDEALLFAGRRARHDARYELDAAPRASDQEPAGVLPVYALPATRRALWRDSRPSVPHSRCRTGVRAGD